MRIQESSSASNVYAARQEEPEWMWANTISGLENELATALKEVKGFSLPDGAGGSENTDAIGDAIFNDLQKLRTADELNAIEQIIRAVVDGDATPNVELASNGDIHSTDQGNMLPPNVLGAFVPGENGEPGTILISSSLLDDPRKLASVMLEEVGEAIGDQAKTEGLELAPGDVGDRIEKVVSTDELDSSDFVVTDGGLDVQSGENLDANTDYDEQAVLFNGVITDAKTATETSTTSATSIPLLYQLQNASFTSLSNTDFQVAVVDPDDSSLSAEQVDTLQSTQGKKLYAYTSIGEAEDYRDYWQDSWSTQQPDFLLSENSDWAGNFRVEFWDSDWQQVIFQRVDDVLAQGYDGVYLDIVDGYAVDEVIAAYPGTEAELRQEMIDFVINISDYAKSKNPDFAIIPQNAVGLLGVSEEGPDSGSNTAYLNAIDGLGVEDLWFDDDKTSDWTEGDLGYIKLAQDAGKFVLATSYPTEQANQEAFLSDALSNGLIPFVADRELTGVIDADNVGLAAEMAGISSGGVTDTESTDVGTNDIESSDESASDAASSDDSDNDVESTNEGASDAGSFDEGTSDVESSDEGTNDVESSDESVAEASSDTSSGSLSAEPSEGSVTASEDNQAALEERFIALYERLMEKQISFKERVEPFKTDNQNAGKG
ncbi:MAG: MJ1477/TM1410 family putative glycoside hydrolase [Pseudoruegeria sp.]